MLTRLSHIRSDLLIDSISPVNGSIEGGTVIEFSGNGFECDGIEVKIGQRYCEVVTDTVTSYQVRNIFA